MFLFRNGAAFEKISCRLLLDGRDAISRYATIGIQTHLDEHPPMLEGRLVGVAPVGLIRVDRRDIFIGTEPVHHLRELVDFRRLDLRPQPVVEMRDRSIGT